MNRYFLAIAILAVFLFPSISRGDDVLKALIIEGQNNHRDWPTTTPMMKKYLEETNLFEVDVIRTAPSGTDADFHPTFTDYDVVISNYYGAPWPEETQEAFVNYMQEGGGFVVVHAANNAFGDWREYNEIIGIGGWGGRNENSGPYVYLNEEGELVRDESEGNGGGHGPQRPFPVIVRDRDHPITAGMPQVWMHTRDELYDSLRGPALNIHILATGLSTRTHHHEPMLFTVEYGKGRTFHTPMGHAIYSMECVGFITTFQRGCQWAATGEVTLPLPDDFPTADEESKRVWEE